MGSLKARVRDWYGQVETKATEGLLEVPITDSERPTTYMMMVIDDDLINK